MAVVRRPRKALIQFAVALVVALALGAGAIAVTLTVVSRMGANAQQAAADKAKAEAELARLRDLQQGNQNGGVMSYRAVRAMRDIAAGQAITQDMLSEVPLDQRPENGTITAIPQAVGRVARLPISANEALSESKLADSGGSITVPAGMRAIAIQVDNIGGLGGSLPAGSHVDVLTTIDRDGKTVARTILQDATVVAVANGAIGSTQAPGGTMNTAHISGGVTLAVTPRQAELLALANQLGKFHLTLRNFNDNAISRLAGADLAQLANGGANAVAARPARRRGARTPVFPNVFSSAFAPTNGVSSGFVPISNTALPAPPDTVSTRRFSMQVYRGTGTETVVFEK